MEKRKEALSALKICRFCLCKSETLTSIYDSIRAPKNSVTMPLKILTCISMEVFPSDKMPAYLCARCKLFMDLFYQYKTVCRQGDESILQFLQSGTVMEPVFWPPTLTRAFHCVSKGLCAPGHGVVKTVVEGGATVEVSTQDLTDSEDDDENTYNIKIADASDEESKSGTCIKVVAATDQLDMPKAQPTQAKGFSSLSKLARHVRTHAGERAYPCKYCNKSFMKSHHYTRHVRLKHRETIRTGRGPFGQTDVYRCEQCEDSFTTQDELIYHSAIHATQNLTCPLCQEKFHDIDAVTAHIKSHVNGTEFMCDLCELVFTSKQKLDNHLTIAHDDEIRQEQSLALDESSMEVDTEDYDEDNSFNVKEEDGQMVVEVKKPDDFMINNLQELEEKTNNTTNSEDSEAETTYTELSTVDTLAMAMKSKLVKTSPFKSQLKPAASATKTASILRKAEEVKRKVVQQTTETSQSPVKKEKSVKVESATGANDKSLRLLEKELQDLKRTNTRTEAIKTPGKLVDTARIRRQQLHTSTPKLRSGDEKKMPVLMKSPALEKKLPERRIITKENKEPKDKEAKPNNTNTKDEKEKEKETPKSVAAVKNGTNDRSSAEDGVRRSTRPSKIKDYAKMIRDGSQPVDDDDDDDDDDSDDKEDEEYRQETMEIRLKARRGSSKVVPRVPPQPAAAKVTPHHPTPTPRKRGRPRIRDIKDVPSKLKKQTNDETEEQGNRPDKSASEDSKEEQQPANEKEHNVAKDEVVENNHASTSKAVNIEQITATSSNLLVSPTGQTLKKVPVKSLPPGVKPLPLPLNARPVSTGELCEMQIGKKMVKVQKIVMTKAEVEAMAKKGLVEMKDGTMVLKQGIKIPTSDPQAIKSTLVGEDVSKESPNKKDSAAPTRCTIDEDI